jgi:ABC-type multidrug transport system permease subunit
VACGLSIVVLKLAMVLVLSAILPSITSSYCNIPTYNQLLWMLSVRYFAVVFKLEQ